MPCLMDRTTEAGDAVIVMDAGSTNPFFKERINKMVDFKSLMVIVVLGVFLVLSSVLNMIKIDELKNKVKVLEKENIELKERK